MRILVTGGAGFVGTNLIKQLLEEGHDVISIDNYSTGKKENHITGCTYVEGDISQYTNIKKYNKPVDIIFHMAAIARIQPSFEHPVYTHHSNVTSTLNLLDWARSKKIPVVYAGSSSSNGDKFANPYTLSKSQGEQLVELYNKVYDLPTVICRFYNVYGPKQISLGSMATVIGIFENCFKKKTRRKKNI